MEIKNTSVAVDAYQKAVDINPCDYWAWYGLGQAYEMTGMPFNGSQLWIAMACY